MAIIVNTVTIAAVVVIILRRSCQVSPRIEKAYIRVHGSVQLHSKSVTQLQIQIMTGLTQQLVGGEDAVKAFMRWVFLTWPPATCSPGYSHLVICSPGYLVTCLFSPGHLLIWLLGHLMTWLWSPAHLVILTYSPGHLVTWLFSPGSSHLVTWPPGHLVTWLSHTSTLLCYISLLSGL